MGIKNAEFYADFKSIEKFSKKFTQKSYKQNKSTNMSKSEKSAYLRHVFVNNFFRLEFLKNFST